MNGTTASTGKGMNIGLWIAQGLLALAFLGAASGKLMMSAEDLAKHDPSFPFALMKFIGIAELAGALGMILPSATRIAPKLTPIAAIGLVIIMVLAFGHHVRREEWSHTPPTIVLGALAAFVAWGRFRKAPIASR